MKRAPRLIDNAGAVLRRAWSVRLSLLASLLAGLEALGGALPQLQAALPPRLFAALSAACAIGAIVARVVSQANLRPSP